MVRSDDGTTKRGTASQPVRILSCSNRRVGATTFVPIRETTSVPSALPTRGCVSHGGVRRERGPATVSALSFPTVPDFRSPASVGGIYRSSEGHFGSLDVTVPRMGGMEAQPGSETTIFG